MNKTLYKAIKKEYPDVKIVLASKYLNSFSLFKPFLDEAFYDFGENRVEAILEKQAYLKDYPIKWHFIGTLQSKKVKKVIHLIDTLHTLDHMSLAKEIEKRRETPLKCYIQVNISLEPQKHGLALDEVKNFVDTLKDFKKIHVCGLMGMAQDTSDESIIKDQFKRLRDLRDTLQKDYPNIKALSMGMSQDYKVALKEGATVLRLGRILLAEDSEWEKN
ncbi:MAG: YggS family pyridoxal phosphate-dependent enzyme [Candidatus Izemoplasmataceae bacterium]